MALDFCSSRSFPSRRFASDGFLERDLPIFGHRFDEIGSFCLESKEQKKEISCSPDGNSSAGHFVTHWNFFF